MLHVSVCACLLFIFFFNDTATTEISTLPLHDALPICSEPRTGSTVNNRQLKMVITAGARVRQTAIPTNTVRASDGPSARKRSEEHTSELQSRQYLVCRLLLEKKKIRQHNIIT